MGTILSRRDILKLVAGGAAGFLLTPIPWKLVGDSAVWTQNWPWLPKPVRGESTAKFAVCTLCPAACPLTVRCIGSQPVSVSSIPRHSACFRPLCPVGVAGHQLPYHPLRLAEPVRLDRQGDRLVPLPVSLDEIVSDVRSMILAEDGGATRFAILDQRPGRAISSIYKKIAGRYPDGLYLNVWRGATPLSHVFHSMVESPFNSEFGFDLANATEIISFGVPLVDFWQTRSDILRRLQTSPVTEEKKELHIIQIEPEYSRTAAIADEWIPLRPGSELPLALAIAHVILRDNLVDENVILTATTDFTGNEGTSYRDIVQQYSPEYASRMCDVPAGTVERLARHMVRQKSTVVLGWCGSLAGEGSNEKEIAIAGLNILLGNIGRQGGVLMSGHSSPPMQDGSVTLLDEVPDHSLRLLVLDPAESGIPIPPEIIGRKLHPEKGCIVSLSPYLTGLTMQAKYIVPSPANFESLSDVVSTLADGSTCIKLSPQIQLPPQKVTEPLLFCERLTESLGLESLTDHTDYKTLLSRSLGELRERGEGTVVRFNDGATTGMKEFGSTETLFDSLLGGAALITRPRELSTREVKFALRGRTLEADSNLRKTVITTSPGKDSGKEALVAISSPEEAWLENIPMPPALSKIYQESGLRTMSCRARIHPETADAHHLREGESRTITGVRGNRITVVHIDSTVMPGLVVLSYGPSPMDDGNRTKQLSGRMMNVGITGVGVSAAILPCVEK